MNRFSEQTEVELDRFELVLLKRPTSYPALLDAQVDELQARHPAHLREQTNLGNIRVVGPLDEQQDQSLRGMCLYQTGSLERSRFLASSDLSVLAGRLEVDIMYFYCPAGSV
jgi:uncharacterized protein